MTIIFALLGAVIGMALAEIPGLVAGGVLGALCWQVLDLRRQLRALRESKAAPVTGTAPQPTAQGGQPAAPPAPRQPPPADRSEPTPTPPTAPAASAPAAADSRATAAAKPARPSPLDTWVSQGVEWVRGFLFGGNPIVRIGIIVLFFGVAFLLKYAADQSLLPIEARLSAVAAGGLGLLGLGWWLRGRNAVFAMSLQGGAVGVLYLTVFAAAQLYDVIPVGLAFGVMVGIVVLSAVLAVLQNAMALAVFGTAGGFLAPVLVSTGSGSHVVLFSYYALLNVGILGIAWFRAWRVLNLLGFVFTFVIGGAWGYTNYRPELFASTEPFLVLFFLFFVAIAVLYAFRQPAEGRTDDVRGWVSREGYVDGSLVFGVPLVGFGLQAALVRSFEFGMAYSAVVLAAFYLVLASALWRYRPRGMRALTEAFLSLGVVFATLAVPLAFDGRWTAAVWALEGAGIIWVGIRQDRWLARAAGAALQLAAGVAFAGDAVTAVDGLILLNGFYIGCLVISLGAWVSAYLAHRARARLGRWEPVAGTVLLYWGMLWWFAGGFEELGRNLSGTDTLNGAWLLMVATTAAAVWLARRWQWDALGYMGAVLLPVMLFTGFPVVVFEEHLLIGWGWLPWLALGAVHYVALAWFDTRWPRWLVQALHALGGWAIVAVLSLEGFWLVGQWLDAAQSWSLTAGAVPAIVAVFLLVRMANESPWPFGTYGNVYTQWVAMPLTGLLALWVLWACGHDADPAVIAYVPLINPLEIAQAAVLLAAVVLFRHLTPRLDAEQRRLVVYGLAVLTFVGLNAVLARSVHHWTGVDYTPRGLWDSALLQSTFAVFWTVAALGLMAFAARRGLRPVWFAGAALLGLVLAKLFLVDLAGVGTIARIVSFLGVGGLMLVIGYFSPLPPRTAPEGET